RRIRRRVGPIRRVRITVAGTKYVAMSVTGTRRRAVFRLVRVRIGGLAGRDVHRADFQGLAVIRRESRQCSFVIVTGGLRAHNARVRRPCDVRTERLSNAVVTPGGRTIRPMDVGPNIDYLENGYMTAEV